MRGAHAFGERRDVRAELALDDLALLAACTNSIGSSRLMMFEPPRRVQVIDHRRERGRLAGAGRAGHEHHALVEVAELLDDRAAAPRLSSVGTSLGMSRNVAPTPVSLRNTLTRNRPPSPET